VALGISGPAEHTRPGCAFRATPRWRCGRHLETWPSRPLDPRPAGHCRYHWQGGSRPQVPLRTLGGYHLARRKDGTGTDRQISAVSEHSECATNAVSLLVLIPPKRPGPESPGLARKGREWL